MLFPTLARRTASSTLASKIVTSTTTTTTRHQPLPGRYKPKKVWPPDFKNLSRMEQFRLEKKYKRRVKLATARPRWDKFVRLAQLGSVSFVLVYSVLFMDWNTERQPFEGVRNAFWGAMGAFSPEKRHERNEVNVPPTTTSPK
ncbi:hypothetical protein F5Y17DRAFT_182222 [Xylariaceae sp. FL0594]|nr:hypothetical protein F5Y17DRAFT_182222 [Xylariaceae sp. FL0594]